MISANPFARIVVGYDDSASADAALEQSLALAETYGGDIVAVHISDLPAPAVLQVEGASQPPKPDAAPVLAALDPYRRHLFEKLSERVKSRLVPVSMEFSTNVAAAGITDAATRWRATAIAVGTHGPPGVAHLLVGSVAEAVVRTTPVPVIVTRERVPAQPLQRIVVGVDAAEPSEDATSFAVSLAHKTALRLVYCSVVDTNTIMRPTNDLPFDPVPIADAMRSAAHGALDAATQYANAADVFPDTEVVEADDAASGIVDVARRHGAGAIVVGTHKRGNVERFFLGSTAESVLRRSNIPVIVVPIDTSSVPGRPSRVTAGA